MCQASKQRCWRYHWWVIIHWNDQWQLWQIQQVMSLKKLSNTDYFAKRKTNNIGITTGYLNAWWKGNFACFYKKERKKLKVIRFWSLESYSASCTSREVVLFVRPRLLRTRIIAAISTNAIIPSKPTSKPANRNHWGLSSVESFDKKDASKAVEKRKFVL